MATVTHGALSSNDLVNGILWDGWQWQDGGTPLNITYFFAEDGGVSWTQSAKTALITAFGTYAQFANITFSETAVRADADFVENLLTGAQQPGAVGSHDTPQGAANNQAAGYYTIDYSSWGGPADWTTGLIASGGYVEDIMIHELGHALGLKHPHDIIGSAPTFPGVTDGDTIDPGSNDLNHMFFSTMSYIQSYHFDVDGRLVLDPTRFTVNNQLDYGYASTPMAFDIAAIQYLYGVNSTYHTGNDVYLLPEADVIGAVSTSWSSIWDAGGSDTLEYDGSGNAILDLRAATLDDSPTGGGILSYAAFIHGGFTIANGVVIEKAVGGSGNDSITGNSADNTFKGRGGDDTIEGGAGTDTAIMAGLRSSYTVTSVGNAQLLVVGLDGTDTLTNVERLQFDDSLVTYEIRVNDLDGDSVTFTEGGSAVHLDAGTAATVTDSDPADFNVSQLTVSITANKKAGEDLLGIDTSAATTVTLSAGLTAGSTVSVGATAIGTIAVNGDGANGHDLIVIFNANATPARVGTLLEALTYSDSNQADPSTLPRTVAVTLYDDDGATSTAANVTVDVVAVNDAPVVTADAGTITEDTVPNPITGNVLTNDSDPEGNALTVTNAGTFNLGHGSLILHADGSYTYTLDNTNPAVNALNAGQSLVDSFTYNISDGHGGTDSASLAITIHGSTDNDAPVANADAATITEDTVPNPITGSVLTNDTDADGNTLSVSNAGTFNLAHGSLEIHADGSYTYTLDNSNPAVHALNAGQTLLDSFTYAISDGHGGTDSASLAITIHGSTDNDAPVANADAATITEDTAPNLVTGNVLTNDNDADGNTLSVSNAGTFNLDHGSLEIHADGSYTYTLDNSNPAVHALNAGQTLVDSFTYVISDGHGGTDSASLAITIHGTTDSSPPVVAGSVTLTAIAENSGARLITQAQLLANVTDVDGPSLTAANLAIATGAGTLVDNHDGTWSYTSALNDDSAVSFSYQVTDGGTSVANSATLDITPVNSAPVVAGSVTLSAIAEDSGTRLITQAQLLGNVTDVDGPSLTAIGFAIATGSGSLVNNNNGTWTYTPAHNDDASVTFSYQVTDGTTSVADNATLDITPVNDAPVNEIPASQNVAANTRVAIAGLGVSDVDSTSLTTTLHVEHGTLIVGAAGGATVAGSGSSTVTLTGSAAQIDAALGAANNVLYHGAFDFSGIEHLTMTSNDGTLSDTDVLNLGVFKQIAVMEIYGITRPALTIDSSGHIILDAATSEFVATYGSKLLYAGVPEGTLFPPVAAHDFHLV